MADPAKLYAFYHEMRADEMNRPKPTLGFYIGQKMLGYRLSTASLSPLARKQLVEAHNTVAWFELAAIRFEDASAIEEVLKW